MPPRRRQHGDPVNGMLLLDKPGGLSSNQALQKAKRLLNAQKAGHTGSLDPIATGLLPLCFGEATKVAGLFLNADKTYWTRIRLGVATDTGDREGRVVREVKVEVGEKILHAALAKFRGEFEQTPPMHSALKHRGQPLYKLARQGITVSRAPRAVTVSRLSLEKWRGDEIELTLACSHGFYVRTLATDLGDALGCGAHVRELRRTAVGNFSLGEALTLTQIEALDDAARQKILLPTERGAAHLPAVTLSAAAAKLRSGQSVRDAADDKSCAKLTGLVRVYDDDMGLLGIAERAADGQIAPRRLFRVPQ